MYRIPQTGLDDDALFARLESYRADDLDWRKGRTFAYVYDPGAKAEQITKKAFLAYMKENALDPTVFPSLLKLENELLGMALSHLNGPDDAVGNFTSGGTESILLSVLAARDHARKVRGITNPKMLLPATTHAAFQKAGRYLGVDYDIIDVDPVTFRADPRKMADAIDDRTILIVGSAPSYAHGVIDPIAALSEVALEHDVFLHVDACVGGFMLPYFRRLGRDVPAFDFSLPGVTSISMDFHKYAFTAKGGSVILYRDKALRKHQIFASASWTGYTHINPTVQSTRSGGPLAAAWAVLHHVGDEGYLRYAADLVEGTDKLVAGIEAMPELTLLAKPDMCLLAFQTEGVDLFHLVDEMKERGWYIQPQLRFRDYRTNIHLSVNPGNVKWIDAFLADLRDAIDAAKQLPSIPAGDLLGQLAPLLSGDLPPEAFGQLLSAVGVEGTGLPGRMATINAMLDALPPHLSEELLVNYLNVLYCPS